MTVFEKIVEAIKPFNYPYSPDVYTGCEDRYFVYNYADERGSLFADNEAQEVTVSIQLHFYMPLNDKFSKIKRDIKKALVKQGFTYPEITILHDDDKRHIIFESDMEIEMEEE